MHFVEASDFKCHRVCCNFAADLGNAQKKEYKFGLEKPEK